MSSMKPVSFAVATACALMAMPTAFAQPTQQSQDEDKEIASVVVTATRTAKAVDKIPGAVSVITQQELSTQYLIADDPSQALATYVPGYAPSRQKMTSTGESLRGRQPLILFDGIPQSNPLRAGMREGYFADSAIIERIEVINGASAMQGMGATGGIINYITKTPRTKGTKYTVNTRFATQFRSDNLDWKTGLTVNHKSDAFDLLGYASVQRRGMAYDGNGRRLGIDTVQGDTLDSHGNDIFLKIGKSFGDQRLQLSLNRFDMSGDGDYRNDPGAPKQGITTSSVPGTPEGMPARNRVRSASLDYRHADLAGGALTAQVFKHDFESLYGATDAVTFQDPRIVAPPARLFDQSEVVADKIGSRITYVRPNTLVDGLELTAGLDWLKDHTQQRLAGTNRVWVPELKFRSVAPFAQLEYEFGDVTVRGGVRHEDAKLEVDTYTTLNYYGNRVVQGGSAEFSKSVKNLGAVWRFAPQWSAFASVAEGFGLPDAGLVLRGVNRAGQSVASLISLQPIITRNKEVGVNWRGANGQFGISRYDSRSKLGSVLRVTNGVGELQRVPTTVKGWEANAEWKPVKGLSLFGTYAITDGKTAVSQGMPMDLDLGARSQGPDKAVLGANWSFMPTAQLRLQATHLRDRDINIDRKSGATNLEEHFKGYTLVDAATTFQTRYGRVGVSIENLFDKHYVGYYSQSALATDETATFAGRGRTLAVSWSQDF